MWFYINKFLVLLHHSWYYNLFIYRWFSDKTADRKANWLQDAISRSLFLSFFSLHLSFCSFILTNNLSFLSVFISTSFFLTFEFFYISMTSRNYVIVRKVLLLFFGEKSSIRKITTSSTDYFLQYIIKYDSKVLQKYGMFFG